MRHLRLLFVIHILHKLFMHVFQEGITATEQVKQWQFDTKETLEKLEQMKEVGLIWQTALDSSEFQWTDGEPYQLCLSNCLLSGFISAEQGSSVYEKNQDAKDCYIQLKSKWIAGLWNFVLFSIFFPK